MVTGAADPDEAAHRYETELKSFYGAGGLDPTRPLFDVVLMGVGLTAIRRRCFRLSRVGRDGALGGWRPQAHVEPFVPRVSLTLPALGSCREMLFEVSGADKRAILTRVPLARTCRQGVRFPSARRRGWWIAQHCRRIFVR